MLRFGFSMLWFWDWFCWFGLLLVAFLFAVRDVVSAF